MLFLVRTISELPSEFPSERRDEFLVQESRRSMELFEAGKLISHWKVPVVGETVTLWNVTDAAELHGLLMALPAAAWARSSVTPLVERNLQQHAQINKSSEA
jgi:muconolactone D-isomerase